MFYVQGRCWMRSAQGQWCGESLLTSCMQGANVIWNKKERAKYRSRWLSSCSGGSALAAVLEAASSAYCSGHILVSHDGASVME